ncbi:hypothetical protein MA16_Dca027484 [Dendrobium catenatum]|uniref:Uncharacterized protein n=1 Tax=Dendrobium catenatum TaxID=906689 RepID=A0A2I0VB07_9ASPA|nr:hypothetical protein MA16_Dca027484 [Dendrobium catenatum]
MVLNHGFTLLRFHRRLHRAVHRVVRYPHPLGARVLPNLLHPSSASTSRDGAICRGLESTPDLTAPGFDLPTAFHRTNHNSQAMLSMSDNAIGSAHAKVIKPKVARPMRVPVTACAWDHEGKRIVGALGDGSIQVSLFSL